MPMPPRKRRDPMLMGLPSPSLTKMGRMGPAEINQHVEHLQVEAQRIASKLERLQQVKPLPTAKIETLRKQLDRLKALEKAARDRCRTID